jgi:putative (di)nucleoside polyphosphate hydrolase
VIDLYGFRLNVGIVIANNEQKLFWGKRMNQKSWQFPQGGIKHGERLEDAMYRELHEEVGLKPEDVEVIGQTQDWLTYKLPPYLIRKNKQPICIGQRQKWFLLKISSSDSAINLTECAKPEFDYWKWVDYWYPIHNVVSFKRQVYKNVLNEFRSKIN